MEEKLTVFYLKRTGKVRCFCTGEQSMDYFADEKEDMELIVEFIIVDYDEFIVKNYNYYKVVEGKLIFDKTL